MITNRNIVCIASNWFDHPTSKQHVMRRLARHNHVVWVNFHASRRPQLNRSDAALILRRLRQALRRRTERVEPGIDVLSPLLIPFPESGWARWLNGMALVSQVRSVLRRLPQRPTQLWLFTPDMPEIIPRFGAERVVYYCVDDFAAFAGFNTTLIERLESKTMSASDVVITTSRELFDGRRHRHPCVHLVPHGVDAAHFGRTLELDDADVPPRLRSMPHPIFGFMGLINEWVDLELIAHTARLERDWSFVLLGDARRDLTCVRDLPNVHLLGGRPYEELPAYCRAFDVGLIPFRMSRLVRAVNPIKLREYLAAGLPVVSAPMEAVRGYGPAVQLADTVETFRSACRRALEVASEQPAAARQALVASESWEARLELLAALVQHRPPTVAPDQVSVTVPSQAVSVPGAECAVGAM